MGRNVWSVRGKRSNDIIFEEEMSSMTEGNSMREEKRGRKTCRSS